MPRVTQHADSFLQRQVRGAAEPVKAVKQPASVFGHFQCLGSFPRAAIAVSEVPGGRLPDRRTSGMTNDTMPLRERADIGRAAE